MPCCSFLRDLGARQRSKYAFNQDVQRWQTAQDLGTERAELFGFNPSDYAEHPMIKKSEFAFRRAPDITANPFAGLIRDRPGSRLYRDRCAHYLTSALRSDRSKRQSFPVVADVLHGNAIPVAWRN